MNGSRWREHSIAVIESVGAALPTETPEKEVRRAISQAYPFGERDMGPYAVWLSEVRRYLDRRFRPVPDRPHGGDLPILAETGSLWEALEGGER